MSSEAGCAQAALFTFGQPSFFPPVPFLPIGSDDKISVRVRAQLSLNEAVIERWATVFVAVSKDRRAT